MNIRNVMENLLHSLRDEANRRKGHTSNALDFARRIKARYVCHNHQYAQDLHFYCNKTTFLAAFENGKSRAFHEPIVLDNNAIVTLLELATARISELEAKEAKTKELVQETLEQSEWALMTLREKLLFGMDEAQAVYRRESRVKGVLITTVDNLKELLK